jgi:hypothetical protein
MVPVTVRYENRGKRLPVLAIISPSASTSSVIISASTRPASLAPKFNVDVVGENVRLGSSAITRVGLVKNAKLV